MIAFSRRETCWGGIWDGVLSEHATSSPSISRSPISISSFYGFVTSVDALAISCCIFWVYSWLFRFRSISFSWWSLVWSVCWVSLLLTLSSWRISSLFWVCTLLLISGPEIFLACLFLVRVLMKPSTSWFSWCFLSPGLLFCVQSQNRCPCSWHLLHLNGICS